MRKAILLSLVTLLLLPSVMTGCVAKADYDSVVGERDTAKAQVVSLQTEVDATKAQVSSLQTDRDASKAQAASLQTELDASKAQVASLQTIKSNIASIFTQLQKELEAQAMLDGYWRDEAKYSATIMSASEMGVRVSQFYAGYGIVLDAVGNAELSQLWKDAMASGNTKVVWAKLAAIMDSLTAMITKDRTAIEAELD